MNNTTTNTRDKVIAAANAWLDCYVAGYEPPAYVTPEILRSYRTMFVEQLMGDVSCRDAHDTIEGDWVELGTHYRGVQLYLYELADAIEGARAAKRQRLAEAALDAQD